MNAPEPTLGELRWQVWWWQIRVLTGQLSPMLRRWLERFGGQMLPGLRPRRLDDPHPAASSIAEQLATLQPGGVVVVPAFFVGKSTAMFSGLYTLWPLTQYFLTLEAAERQQRQIARHFPGCVVLSVALTFDPGVPAQLADLEAIRQELIVEAFQ